ncbi:MAG TPA: DUF3237 family protein [Microbacterium sp.]|nr:DUF3237 family protein [Microbacterium sp.]
MTHTEPRLGYRFTIVAEVEPWIEIGTVNTEQLLLVPIVGGTVRGEVSGEVLPSGGDWARLAEGDLVHVEARYLVRSDSGSVIEVLNTGIGHRVEGGEQLDYFATRPIFRTADPALEWLTRAVFVGWARVAPGATTIDVYEVLAAAGGEESHAEQ